MTTKKPMTQEKIKKQRTNDQAFKELFYHLDSFQVALLRERVLFICEQTSKDCMNWENAFVNPRLYVELNQKVQKHLGFED
jgi:hypothetical protein